MHRFFRWLSGIRARRSIPRASGAVPQALTLLGGVRFITWHLRGMPTGPEALLEPPGASGPRPCPRIPPKDLVTHSSVWWDVRQISVLKDLFRTEVFQRTVWHPRPTVNVPWPICGRKAPFPASAGPPSVGWAAPLTLLSPLYGTGPCCTV